jgi:hypothetical protein
MIHVVDTIVLEHDASGIVVLLVFSDSTSYTVTIPNERSEVVS